MYNVAHQGVPCHTGDMITASEMGKRGASITNAMLTTEKRSKAAKKGWKKRKQKLKALNSK